MKNWIDDNGCIAREETAYLGCQDLISVAAPEDSAVTWFEDVVGAALVLLQKWLDKSTRFSVSKDPNVHVFPQLALTRTARFLMTPFLISLLLGPVIVCKYISSLNARLFVIVAATTAFIGVLSGLTRAKANELAVAGATYTIILIVFISTTDIGPG